MRHSARLAGVLALMFWSQGFEAQRSIIDAPVPGVAESLATDRAARVFDLRYNLAFTIPAGRSERIAGHAVITFSLREVSAPLQLDFEPNAMGALRLVDVGGVHLD